MWRARLHPEYTTWFDHTGDVRDCLLMSFWLEMMHYLRHYHNVKDAFLEDLFQFQNTALLDINVGSGT